MAKPSLGDVVTYVDEHQQPRAALVTFVGEGGTEHPEPWVNLVYVIPDASMQDSYGRQITRVTSIAHQTSTPAPGVYWKAAA